ncbi:hypothetical protein OPV22_006473 [Ensete ventricosum]|uniref:Uncharacterized protein n=1 Tax=Ensete ventricosum TaxID=4639 RepID=A0AAV8Q4A1_ENSVE|nr:hypothetical protein OPV22_006473 [Ensete ventricosum]
METLNDAAAFFLPSKLLHPLSDALPFLKYPGGGQLLRLLLRCLLSAFHCLLYLLSLLLFHLPSHLHPPPPHTLASGSSVAPLADGSRAGRGLSRVLFAVAHVPVASRKYDFVRSLAERILDDNLRATGGADLQTLNCTVLSAAFARTLHGLEEALAAEAASANGVRSRGQIMGALKSRVRAWAAGRVVPPAGEAGAGVSAEKLAAEAMWLGQKMAENGAAAEGVAMWGSASRLAGLAVSAEPRLQVALVRRILSLVIGSSYGAHQGSACGSNAASNGKAAFMVMHANSKQLEEECGAEKGKTSLASHQVSMLKSWLPLLCCACSGVDNPILSSKERAEMVSLLGDMIDSVTSKRALFSCYRACEAKEENTNTQQRSWHSSGLTGR